MHIWMFQGLTPVLVLTERIPLPFLQNQERVQAGLKLQIKCFPWGNVVHHILPKGFWVFVLNGNRRARWRYLISKYPSILQKRKKDCSLFSFFLKNVFSALHKIHAHVNKHSCNLTVTVETLHLPCGNKPHQTQRENKILYQVVLWPLTSRDWDVAKPPLFLLVSLYFCTGIFLYKAMAMQRF